MSWFSILPANLTIVETWIVRFFVCRSITILAPTVALTCSQSSQLLLGMITIGPWVGFLVYDMILYVFRAVAYEIPYYGGRARGRRRPRAPSLVERPNGRRRTFSISGGSGSGSASDDRGGLKRRSLDDVESSGDEVDVTEEESRAIQSTDLWDAGTDSRFRSGADAIKKGTTKKRR